MLRDIDGVKSNLQLLLKANQRAPELEKMDRSITVVFTFTLTHIFTAQAL